MVVFTDDNGGQTSVGAVNALLRGSKEILYEGELRDPRWGSFRK